MANFAGNLKSVQLYQDVVKAAIDEARADKLRAFFASMKNPHLELQEELKLDAENIQKYRNTMKKIQQDFDCYVSTLRLHLDKCKDMEGYPVASQSIENSMKKFCETNGLIYSVRQPTKCLNITYKLDSLNL